ncbi:MAG: hypothetical protein ACI4BA_06005 [Prevotella sp.]
MAWIFFVAILVILLSVLAIWLSGKEAATELEEALTEEKKQPAGPCGGCAFAGHTCVEHCTMHGGSTETRLFRDAELNFFMGRSADSYTDDEAYTFRRILYSMHGNEVNEWCRSLRRRGIELPEQVKTDVLTRMNY